jgi:hypothetical protein
MVAADSNWIPGKHVASVRHDRHDSGAIDRALAVAEHAAQTAFEPIGEDARREFDPAPGAKPELRPQGQRFEVEPGGRDAFAPGGTSKPDLGAPGFRRARYLCRTKTPACASPSSRWSVTRLIEIRHGLLNAYRRSAAPATTVPSKWAPLRQAGRESDRGSAKFGQQSRVSQMAGHGDMEDRPGFTLVDEPRKPPGISGCLP